MKYNPWQWEAVLGSILFVEPLLGGERLVYETVILVTRSVVFVIHVFIHDLPKIVLRCLLFFIFHRLVSKVQFVSPPFRFSLSDDSWAQMEPLHSE